MRSLNETKLRPALLCCLVSVLFSTRAAAQAESELQQARSQFREGLSLEAAGNWGLALRKFEEVARVKLTPQVRFHIGRCKENLGRLNEALGELRMAEYEAEEERLTELEEMRARLALEATTSLTAFTSSNCSANETVIEQGQCTPIPLDPTPPGPGGEESRNFLVPDATCPAIQTSSGGVTKTGGVTVCCE